MTARVEAALPIVGQRLPDGSVYAGTSPDTGRPMYTTPKDTGLCSDWMKAIDHAAKFDAHGHQDWRVPSKGELRQLFAHRAAIGNFDESGSHPDGWYWSSSEGCIRGASVLRFNDGAQGYNYQHHVATLRCVRG